MPFRGWIEGTDLLGEASWLTLSFRWISLGPMLTQGNQPAKTTFCGAPSELPWPNAALGQPFGKLRPHGRSAPIAAEPRLHAPLGRAGRIDARLDGVARDLSPPDPRDHR